MQDKSGLDTLAKMIKALRTDGSAPDHSELSKETISMLGRFLEKGREKDGSLSESDEADG